MKRQVNEFKKATERMQAAKNTLIKKLTEKVSFPFDIEPLPNGTWRLYEINSNLGMELDEALQLLDREEILTFNEFRKLC